MSMSVSKSVAPTLNQATYLPQPSRLMEPRSIDSWSTRRSGGLIH